VTRKLLIGLALLALALPVAATAALRAAAGDGTLSVEDGRGSVTLRAKGGVIGRIDRGTVTIYDLTPADAYEQRVTGDDRPVRFVGETGIRYAGNGIRFRIVGGEFKVVITGAGIDLSAVGRGNGFIQGAGIDPGLYSLDVTDCRSDADGCKPLPELGRRFQLGGPDKDNGRTP
jgi:hypothetical protein